MLKRLISLSFFIIILCSGCLDSESAQFTPSKKIHLSDYNLISPFFIEQLNEAPFKHLNIWNDSLLKLMGIKSVFIVTRGMKNPESLAEKSIFQFDNNGKISDFKHFQFELSDEAQTHLSIKNDKGLLETYFEEKVNQPVFLISNKQGTIQVRKRSNGINDSTFIMGSYQRPKTIIEKTGDRVSKINIVIKENQPLTNAQQVLTKINLLPETVFYAEKTITYVDENYRPLKTYLINDDFIQTSLVAEWTYENNKKLVQYVRFINSSPIKEYTFTYSDDKLLRSFVFNRINYEVDYR